MYLCVCLIINLLLYKDRTLINIIHNAKWLKLMRINSNSQCSNYYEETNGFYNQTVTELEYGFFSWRKNLLHLPNETFSKFAWNNSWSSNYIPCQLYLCTPLKTTAQTSFYGTYMYLFYIYNNIFLYINRDLYIYNQNIIMKHIIEEHHMTNFWSNIIQN